MFTPYKSSRPTYRITSLTYTALVYLAIFVGASLASYLVPTEAQAKGAAHAKALPKHKVHLTTKGATPVYSEKHIALPFDSTARKNPFARK